MLEPTSLQETKETLPCWVKVLYEYLSQIKRTTTGIWPHLLFYTKMNSGLYGKATCRCKTYDRSVLIERMKSFEANCLSVGLIATDSCRQQRLVEQNYFSLQYKAELIMPLRVGLSSYLKNQYHKSVMCLRRLNNDYVSLPVEELLHQHIHESQSAMRVHIQNNSELVAVCCRDTGVYDFVWGRYSLLVDQPKV